LDCQGTLFIFSATHAAPINLQSLSFMKAANPYCNATLLQACHGSCPPHSEPAIQHASLHRSALEHVQELQLFTTLVTQAL